MHSLSVVLNPPIQVVLLDIIMNPEKQLMYFGNCCLNLSCYSYKHNRQFCKPTFNCLLVHSFHHTFSYLRQGGLLYSKKHNRF